MLERLRQMVGREIRRRSAGWLVESVDKDEDKYVEKLLRAREDTTAVRDGTATEDQTRSVLLIRQTKLGYADLARYCWVGLFVFIWILLITALYQTCTKQAGRRASFKTMCYVNARNPRSKPADWLH